MQLLLLEHYQQVAWKNGLGTSLLIDSDPHQAWRFSAAQVREPSAFSNYAGFKRILTVWRGAGLKLNDHTLLPNNFYYFDGATDIFCKNLSPEVTDLGLIYDSTLFSATAALIEVQGLKKIDINGDIHFIFCAKGSAQISNLALSEGDSIKIIHNLSCQINSSQGLFYIFSLSKV